MKRSIAGAAAAVALTIGAGGAVVVAGAASGSSATPPTTIVPLAGGTESKAIVATPLSAAVSAALPDGATVRSSSTVQSGGASYEDFDARVNGVGYSVTVYQHFDVSELSGLKRSVTGAGTVWVGSEDVEATSIYFQSADEKVAVWVGHTNVGGRAKGVDQLVAIASRLAVSPTVIAGTSNR